VNDLELDVILLAILEASSALLWQDYLKPGRFPLGPILSAHKKELRNMIMVDEAVDFSPVQLKCAMNLSIPSSGSFYATGDFNQRFTPWGAKSMSDFEWAIHGLSESTLTSNHRLSTPLDELARAVAVKPGPHYAENSAEASAGAFKPVLLSHSENLETTVAWLAERIKEIHRKVGQTPATAVTMNSESDLGAVAGALNEALGGGPLATAVYRESEAPEEDAPIKVFNLKRFKGLEFEAVFLLGLDKLVASEPDLFRQYFYVAITRAATFFGAVCEEGLPEPLAQLKPHFRDDWA
jgi:superfamily I DNA/RNA helicase